MEGNIISIAYAAGMDINAMVFDFTLVAGASIKSPANKTFDLELADGTLVITYGGVDYTFVVRATGYTDPLLSNGWTDETAKFGSLPKYIKVYKNEDLLNKPESKSLGYMPSWARKRPWVLSAAAKQVRSRLPSSNRRVTGT